jgi:hypothetical protein
MQRRGYTDSPQPSYQGARPYDGDDIAREETRGLQAPPENFNPDLLRRSPSIDSDTRGERLFLLMNVKIQIFKLAK